MVVPGCASWPEVMLSDRTSETLQAIEPAACARRLLERLVRGVSVKVGPRRIAAEIACGDS